MSDVMEQCINPDQSLAELYRIRSELIKKKRIGHNNPFIVESVRVSLSDINAHIKKVEDIGFNRNGIIRIM